MVLFDLDDTLLRNESYAFFRRYVALLAPHMTPWMTPDQLMHLMIRASEAMIGHEDASETLLECFWATAAGSGYPIAELETAFHRFYETDYLSLGQYTEPMPGARETVEWVVEQEYDVAIATSPMFTKEAIRRRLEWANVADIDYALITTSENMHYAKPNPRYYKEILAKLSYAAEECVMVGNDVEQDMIAGQVGMATFLVTEKEEPPDVELPIDGYGMLADFRAWLKERNSAN
jgi:HAD superfamily hydrolase (TIGR01549 family)